MVHVLCRDVGFFFGLLNRIETLDGELSCTAQKRFLCVKLLLSLPSFLAILFKIHFYSKDGALCIPTAVI
jgi:hypothetical protein